MAKKQTKELIRKPDFLLTSIEAAYTFVRNNLRIVIVGLTALCVVVASVYAYAAYANRQEQKAQAILFQGIRAFEDFTQTGRQESLKNAETVFQTLIKEKRGKAYRIAMLYLATIYTSQGKAEEARALYQELTRAASGTILQTLAEQALQGIEKK